MPGFRNQPRQPRRLPRWLAPSDQASLEVALLGGTEPNQGLGGAPGRGGCRVVRWVEKRSLVLSVAAALGWTIPALGRADVIWPSLYLNWSPWRPDPARPFRDLASLVPAILPVLLARACPSWLAAYPSPFDSCMILARGADRSPSFETVGAARQVTGPPVDVMLFSGGTGPPTQRP